MKHVILTQPELFDMEDCVTCWGRARTFSIEGIALRVAGRDPERVIDCLEEARTLLGLSQRQADALFNVSAWPPASGTNTTMNLSAPRTSSATPASRCNASTISFGNKHGLLLSTSRAGIGAASA